MTQGADPPVLRFYRAYPGARDPMPADTSALGALPLSAFQYCEAMRAASAHGWYVFSPKDIQLLFDGYQTLIADADDWRVLRQVPFEPDFAEHWNRISPSEMRDAAPNFLSALPEPGMVQIWTGLFVETAPGWALDFRPLVNIQTRVDLSVFEAIVETDDFAPCPLFINISLRATGREIVIDSDLPLFQVQPVRKDAYRAARAETVDIPATGGSGFDWSATKRTLRMPGVSDERRGPGQYGADTRRRGKRATT